MFSFFISISFIILCVFIMQTLSSNSTKGNHFLVHEGLHLPCHFLDTINLTGSHQFSNGSYFYEDVIIPPDLAGLFNFEIIPGVGEVSTEPHIRGCICKLKPCIKFCCPPDEFYNTTTNSCTNFTKISYSPEIQISLKNGTFSSINVLQNFVLQVGVPCDDMFFLTPQWAEYDRWKLFENGTLVRLEDQVYMYKDEYCFAPQKINLNDTVHVLNPMNCYIQQKSASREIIYAYSMLFSIPFMVITIFVYLLIPELRNQHGKSLSCYLTGLIIGYSSLSYIALSNPSELAQITCSVLGYIAYFSFMASFFWLSVISFDLWHNFCGTRGINRFLEKKRFLIFSTYAWGLPFAFLFLTLCAQQSSYVPGGLKPGIGGDYCFLDMNGWQALIYFYGPILVIIIVNTTMFILTALKINRVQREMSRIMAREDNKKNLRTEKDRFGLFLRLFIVMGVTWSLEILSFFVGNESEWSKLFYVSDICNAFQGFLIFTLFVMRKKVKKLILSRFQLQRIQHQSQYSNKTTSSSITNLAFKMSNFES